MGVRPKLKDLDWPERLHRFLDGCANRRFKFGRFDCGLFAADWARLATGVDFAADFRGAYHSRPTMVAAMRNIGGGDLLHIATTRLGDPLPSVLLAQRGDIVAFVNEDNGTHALAIASSEKIWFPVEGRKGLYFGFVSDGVAAWRLEKI